MITHVLLEDSTDMFSNGTYTAPPTDYDYAEDTDGAGILRAFGAYIATVAMMVIFG